LVTFVQTNFSVTPIIVPCSRNVDTTSATDVIVLPKEQCMHTSMLERIYCLCYISIEFSLTNRK